MSDISEEEFDDSDRDPDYQCENDSSDSEDRLVIVEEAVIEKKGKPSTGISKSKPLPTNPGIIKQINLSESDSTSEDEIVPDKKVNNSNPVEDSTPSAFNEFIIPNNVGTVATNYDFSPITNYLEFIDKAKKEHCEQELNNPSTSKDTCNIPEMLAKYEKSSTLLKETGSDESETEDQTPKTIEIFLSKPDEIKRPDKYNEKARIELQRALHKVHLLCLIASGLHINSVFINNKTIQAALLSILPQKSNLLSIGPQKLVNWFGDQFVINRTAKNSCEMTVDYLLEIVAGRKPCTVKEGVILFVALLRLLTDNARFVMSLQPLPLFRKREKFETFLKRVKNPKNIPGKAKPKPPPKVSSKAKKTKKTVAIISSDSEEEEVIANAEGNEGIDYWVELYDECKEKWIAVDIVSRDTSCEKLVMRRATAPCLYIVAWNSDNSIKDVTRRYIPYWLFERKHNRVDSAWWESALRPFGRVSTRLDWMEDRYLREEQHSECPLPTKLMDFRNHPLYILQRHLLKYEAIYPPDAEPIGYIKKEAIFARALVHQLHAKTHWMRQGKSVRVNEQPYKIVKSRGKSEPLELFGFWQVEDYIAPPLVDGKIPRNDYGNIEIFHPNMVPPGTVHLQVPGLMKIAKQLNIDCVPAVTGFEYNSRGSRSRSHPVIDGVVVRQEFQDRLMDAWNKDADETKRRRNHKRKQAIYKKWLFLTRIMIVRERMESRKKPYEFDDEDDTEGGEPPEKCSKQI